MMDCIVLKIRLAIAPAVNDTGSNTVRKHDYCSLNGEARELGTWGNGELPTSPYLHQ
ncbi:MAG: hypothetical protein QNJ65_10145 [Xenococcaceae cyanobacterium MO_234.B1]|nr:hypothetical protein [Xenococcaceae cyanobacterium MO_234.B1]